MKKYITKQSSIKGAGKGLFTNASFKKGEVIGLAHVDDQPASEIGRNHNHNEKNPTAYSKKINNKRFIYASRNLKPGEEITTNYRLQPELEQPEDFMRKGGSVLRMPNKKNSKGYSRSLSATNKLFTQNFLFAKPKSRKNKVFDPNSKYYAEGGGLHKFVDGGKPCSDEEYWDGENCVPKEKDSSPIMQNPSWQQEPVVNPAAYVSGYRGGNPKMYKYGFIDSDQGNIVGGGGFGFPKPGVHLSALGVVPTSSNDKQYFKGAYEASISKDIKNLNLGLGVNTAITGYPGENGFVRDPIKLQPKLNLKYNFEEGGALLDDYIEVDLNEDEIEEYRRGGYIVEEIDNYQDGGVYTVKGSKGNYKKVNGKWQVDWNKSGKYQPLSKGDVKARTAILDKMAKPVNDGMSKVSSNSSDNTRVNYQKPLVESFNRSNNLESFYKKEREKDLQNQKDATAYHNKTNKISDNFTPKAKENLKNSPVIDNKYFINSQKNPIPMPDGYKPQNTKLESIEMLYPEKYVIGPGGGLAGLGMKASKAAFAFKPISYLPSVGKALTYHSVYDAGTEHVPNTVKLLSDKSEWNNDKSVDLFKNLFKITSTAAGFSKYDKLKYFNRARNVSQFIDKTTDVNKDALKGTKMLKNFVTTFKKYGGQQF